MITNCMENNLKQQAESTEYKKIKGRDGHEKCLKEIGPQDITCMSTGKNYTQNDAWETYSAWVDPVDLVGEYGKLLARKRINDDYIECTYSIFSGDEQQMYPLNKEWLKKLELLYPLFKDLQRKQEEEAIDAGEGS